MLRKDNTWSKMLLNSCTLMCHHRCPSRAVFCIAGFDRTLWPRQARDSHSSALFFDILTKLALFFLNLSHGCFVLRSESTIFLSISLIFVSVSSILRSASMIFSSIGPASLLSSSPFVPIVCASEFLCASSLEPSDRRWDMRSIQHRFVRNLQRTC
jgi:hypothetical protein